MVLCASLSFRGVNRSLSLVCEHLDLNFQTPSFSSVRLWIQRLGYYHLHAPKEHANDWVWIVDHTIQLESTKLLFILGIRLEHLPPVGQALSLEDVEPLALFPVKQSNGDIVFQQLEATIEKTGVPRSILSDAGSDLNKGIGLFCDTYPQTDSFYEFTHKSACILKRVLGKDEVWKNFCEQVTATRRALQQSSIAHLIPPNLKSKARTMNLNERVKWGNRILASTNEILESCSSEERVKFQEQLGWVDSFKEDLQEWGEIMAILENAEEFVRKRGLFPEASQWLQRSPCMAPSTSKAQEVREEILTFIQLFSMKAHLRERLPGSSEVIESCFGKFKQIEKDQAKNGWTSMILALPALVSKTTKAVVSQAMKQVSTKKVKEWSSEYLGSTINSKKRAFHCEADRIIKDQSQKNKGTKVGSIPCLEIA